MLKLDVTMNATYGYTTATWKLAKGNTTFTHGQTALWGVHNVRDLFKNDHNREAIRDLMYDIVQDYIDTVEVNFYIMDNDKVISYATRKSIDKTYATIYRIQNEHSDEYAWE